jgi:NTE family protein
VVIREGPVLEAVRASISIPVIFSVVKRQGKFLVDGGLVDQVPIGVAREMGADFVIAVDVTPWKSERAQYLAENREDNKEPGLFQVMIQTIYLGTYSSTQLELDRADVVIHPNLARIGPAEFNRAGECILEGELTAVDSLAIIKRKLAKAGMAP